MTDYQPAENPQKTWRQFCRAMAKVIPDPKCELYYQTHYHLLVSVVLSAQTTDKKVNECMEPLYRKGFTPESAIRLGVERFKNKIRTIGLAPTKAKNVVALSKLLIQNHDGQVPNDRAALEALPGVGRKTANVILGELFGHPTLAVDTHVYRVSRRLGLHNEKTPEKCEREIVALTKKGDLPRAHHWLILHGRYTCKAIKPECESCAIKKICVNPAS